MKRKTSDSFLPPVSYKSEWLPPGGWPVRFHT